MCRLFAQLSLEPRDGREWLVDAPCSLLGQSSHKGREQKDGWGVGWFEGSRARVVKSPRAIYMGKEPAAFRAAARRAKSTVVIAHIRAASNPRGLPPARLKGALNTQPFSDGRWIFAHNGTLSIPDEVQARLGPWRRKVKGTNDSEVFFWQFRKHLQAEGSPAKALRRCVEEIWELWPECRARHADKRAPYLGLNVVASDGRTLVALCHYPLRGRKLTALCTPRQRWGTMSLRQEDGRLVVASEPMDDGDWSRFKDPEILEAWVKGGRIRSRTTTFRAPGREIPA